MKKFLFILAAVLLSSIGLHAGNTITYTASEKLPSYYGSLNEGETTFGTQIISHEFSNGTGTITCAGEITTIGNEAFRECNGLRTIEIPSSATSIGYCAFQNCSNLTSVTIPNSVTTIGSSAFMYCSGLTSVTIGNSVATIGNWAFDGCTSLTSIEIPQSVTTIEGNAFSNCTNLTSVTVFWTDANSIISISDELFDRIANGGGRTHATLYVPESTSMLYHQANGWKDFGSVVELEPTPTQTITYTATEELSGYNGSLNVGATTFGPAIIRHTFSNGTGTIVCAGEITKIEELAFQYCSGLTSIAIPSSVTILGYSAFYQCTGLQTIMIPNTITMIGNNTFDGCSSLTSVTIPNSVKTISSAAFNKCYSLNSIDIPSSVTTIDFLAFSNCTALTSVTVNWTDAQSIVPIDNGVFDRIANGAGPSGATLYVPEGTHNLYEQVDVWKNFGHIIDPNNCKITYTAPAKCRGQWFTLDVGETTFGPAITTHEFSNGVGTITCNGEITRIGANAFQNCSELTSVTIPNSVTAIHYGAFAFCSGLTSVEIPKLVNFIDRDAFYHSGLKTITIPNHVTVIGNNAFGSCSGLTSVTIENSVKTIDFAAFSDCSALRSIYCYTPVPPSLGADVFKNVPQDISIYTFNTEAYKSAWGSQLPASCFKPISAEIGDFKYEFFVENNQYKARVVANEGSYTQSTITFPEQVSYMDYTFTVTEIGQSAFKNCASLTAVTIPNTVTTIGQYAFFKTGLTSVTIPVSVKEIGAWAFKNCINLKELNFIDRNDPINIGIYAFENMAVKNVAIPDWMTNIPEGLFFHNTKLEAIYLPELVSAIGKHPFGECPFKYIISMSQTPPALAALAFEGHNKDANVIVYLPGMDAVVAYQNSDWNQYFANPNFITNNTYRITSSSTAELVSVIPDEKEKMITIPSVIDIDGSYYNVTGIGNAAFKDDTVLESISLPPTIQYIGDSAFYGCTEMKQTNSRLWEDLRTIGNAAFYGCSALDSIYIPEGVQTMGISAFMDCQNLTSISLPTGLKKIPDDCFHKCPLGTEIIVPEGVETIGKYAFEGTTEARLKAESITLPSTLKEINFAAFYLHDNLNTIICRALTPPTLTGQAFDAKQYQEQQITVYVPNRDVVAAYKRSNWGDSILYQFNFSDLMAEQNKQYLYTVAGDNNEAKNIAAHYCDSIDKSATTTQQVQDYTNRALGKIDQITLVSYKQALADSLVRHAANNAEALQIATQYAPQIKNANFREVAEQLFAEGDKKIAAVFELITLKANYIAHLKTMASGDSDLQKVAEDYSSLIQLAETKEEARALYERAAMRMTINRQIKRDWTGDPIQVNKRKCSTTKGYMYY